MAHQQLTEKQADVMSAITGETLNRHLTKWRQNAGETNKSANDASELEPRNRATFVSLLIFLVLIGMVGILNLIFGAIVGVAAVGLIFAFLVLPISAPFFIAGIGVATLLYCVQSLADRVAASAAQRRGSRWSSPARSR